MAIEFSDQPLTEREAAPRTGISVSTLQKLRMTGGGPRFLKLGHRVLYRDSDIAEWLADRVVRSTSQARTR